MILIERLCPHHSNWLLTLDQNLHHPVGIQQNLSQSIYSLPLPKSPAPMVQQSVHVLTTTAPPKLMLPKYPVPMDASNCQLSVLTFSFNTQGKCFSLISYIVQSVCLSLDLSGILRIVMNSQFTAHWFILMTTFSLLTLLSSNNVSISPWLSYMIGFR